jgi:hypothetical protein
MFNLKVSLQRKPSCINHVSYSVTVTVCTFAPAFDVLLLRCRLVADVVSVFYCASGGCIVQCERVIWDAGIESVSRGKRTCHQRRRSKKSLSSLVARRLVPGINYSSFLKVSPMGCLRIRWRNKAEAAGI